LIDGKLIDGGLQRSFAIRRPRIIPGLFCSRRMRDRTNRQRYHPCNMARRNMARR